jgi:hypothetical protein
MISDAFMYTLKAVLSLFMMTRTYDETSTAFATVGLVTDTLPTRNCRLSKDTTFRQESAYDLELHSYIKWFNYQILRY